MNKLIQAILVFKELKVPVFTSRVVSTTSSSKNPYLGRIEKSKELIRAWDILNLNKNNYSIDHLFDSYDKIIIRIKRLSQLHDARALAGRAVEGFKGKLDMIWTSGQNGLASWTDKDSVVSIWLSVPYQEFPKELMKDGCGFKVVNSTYTSTGISYVCKEQ